ncbi:MAG TPA: hypothetical protein VGC97_05045 [Pyrinomonadaceae bacterium]|jgi:hypothetical protein
MKTHKLHIHALLIIVLSLNLNSLVFAQKVALPSGLTEKSTLVEILNWIDRTSLPQARIGLESNVKEPETGEVITNATRYYEQAFFSKGFRLAKIDGCRLRLRNDNVELIKFETKYPNPAEGSLDDFRKIQNDKSKFTGEFSIPLQKLKANKAPFQHTKKAEQAALLGTWRTEFKRKSEFFLIPSKAKLKSLLEYLMEIEIIGVGQNGRNDSMSGSEITFTFDDKQMSENFYAAFSRAITLCEDK